MATAAADEHARGLAPLVETIIAHGSVHPTEIAGELTARGRVTRTGKPWSGDRVRALLLRLQALKLVSLPEMGPYGTRRYARQPISSHAVTVRRANRTYADDRALNYWPLVRELRAQGFTKPIALAAELNRRGIAPQRSPQWTVESVKHLLARLTDIEHRRSS